MAVLALVAVTACDKLFEIGDYTQSDAAAIGDTFVVTGSYKLRFTVNAADFTPTLVEEAYAAAQLGVTVELDDGSTPVVTVNDDGTFSFSRATATQPYSITVASPVQTVQYQLAASKLAIVERSFGRPRPDPVTLPTAIDFDLGPGPAPGTVVIGSTGMWTFTGTSFANTGTVAFDWSTATPVSSQLGLLRADLNDQLFFLDIGGTTSYSYVYAYSTFALTQTNGVPAMVTGPPPPLVTPDLCTHVVALRPEAIARLQTALPDSTAATYDDWFLFVTPSLGVGPGAGNWAAGAGEAVANTPTEADVDVSYGNPFSGTTLLGSMAAVTYRNLQLGTATPVMVASGGRVWQPLTPGSSCVTSGVVLQSTVAIASKAALAGVLLDADDKVVAIDRAHPIPVTWTSMAAGASDHDTIVLYEVTNDAGATATHLLQRTVTVASSGTLDPALFVAGHTYLISIVSSLGLPDAASGDFDTITYPVANSTTVSNSFTIAD